MYKKLCIGLAVSFCIPMVAAEEGDGWNGQGELGFAQTTGNTEVQSLSTRLKLGYKKLSWEHELELEALRSEDEEKVTAERYGLDWKTSYHLTPDINYLFGKLRYEDDRFSGYDYQGSLIAGYGHQLIKQERTDLKVEAGVGMGRHQRLEIFSESEDQLLGFLRLNFRQKIGDHSVFTQDFRVEGGSENIYNESETGFQVAVMENLALKLSLLIKNNSDVPANTEKTDTLTTVNLVYSF